LTQLRNSKYVDPIRGVPALELPLEVRTESIVHPQLGEITVQMTLVNVVLGSTGTNLTHSWTITTRSRIPDTFVAGMGFNPQRLKRLGLVPNEVTILTRSISHECQDAAREKTERDIFSRFKAWLNRQDLGARVAHLLTQQIRDGRVSRFADPKG
jgi:hypothetical protein